MKSILAFIFVCGLSLNSFAIAFDDLSDSKVKEVTGYTVPSLSAVELLRAEDALVVNAEFLLNHCMNELTPVTHTIVKNENELVVIISALEVQMKKSENVRCIENAFEKASIYVAVDNAILSEYGDKVRVQIAKTNKVFQVMNNDF
ncbi:MAG: hypothetical protein VX583_02395 [Bdellovibrionota bacterium]|nr:hypothetical protein [Pseudobdellovibrionaceae bacterium]|tara:strand:+ start:63902 stop:64339 length:438 start_codon:yes stop_codon:yes gene_type:complete